MNTATKLGPGRGRRRVALGSGFTLVEVMVATVLLSFILVSILTTLIDAYRLAAKARYVDHARYVLKSFADQFLTQQTTDSSGNILPMFVATGQTAWGLSWTNFDGTTSSGGSNQSSAPISIPVKLGDNMGTTFTAYISRQVWYVQTTSGTGFGWTTSVPQNSSAGYILEAQFSASFDPTMSQMLNLPMPPVVITVLRAVP